MLLAASKLLASGFSLFDSFLIANVLFFVPHHSLFITCYMLLIIPCSLLNAEFWHCAPLVGWSLFASSCLLFGSLRVSRFLQVTSSPLLQADRYLLYSVRFLLSRDSLLLPCFLLLVAASSMFAVLVVVRFSLLKYFCSLLLALLLAFRYFLL